jgi:hypothetical protein
MNAKSTLALVAFAALAAGTIVSGSAARAERMPGSYCASGYHQDAQGNCQPDGGTLLLCQPGTHYMPFPNGQDYRCQVNDY